MPHSDQVEEPDRDLELSLRQQAYRDFTERGDSPEPEHVRILESESQNLGEEPGTCEVLLCVVKIPRVRGLPRFFANHGQEAWENERDFLRRAKPEHPNIVRYFDISDKFIFMEHCPLGSLDSYLKPEMIIPLRNWTIQLCSAMVYLHELGYAHNQLYPCNILVGEGGSILKICDFDNVTPANVAGGGSCPSAPELTITQKQTLADKVKDAEGHLCDVYSLGLLIWFMQHGGAEIPDNVEWGEKRVLGDRVKSHLELLNVDGLQYADVMRAC